MHADICLHCKLCYNSNPLCKCSGELSLKVLVTTIDAQWEGMGDVGVGEVRAGTTSPMPDHKDSKLQ